MIFTPTKRVRGVRLLLAVLLVLLAARSTVTADATDTIRLGYYTGDEESLAAVSLYSEYLTAISVDVYRVQGDGTIVGSDALGVVPLAKSLGLRTYACIHNYNNDPAVAGFDASWAYAAIVTHRDAVIDRVLGIAMDGGYDGVNVDLENLACSGNLWADRVAFTGFIYDLSVRLHTAGLRLMISAPGKTEDSECNDWTYPFDYGALGQYADFLQLMTYDQNGPWSGPGPVAGVDWVEACLAYATSLVDPAKLLIGLPAYGYDWDLTASDASNGSYVATSFAWTDVPTLLAKPNAEESWHRIACVPSVRYSEDGHEHEAWYENAESIRTKVALIAEYGLGGLAMWSLGQEVETFWQAVVGEMP